MPDAPHVYQKRMPNGQLSPTWYVQVRFKGRRIVKSSGLTEKPAAEAWAKRYVATIVGERTGAGVLAALRAAAVRGAVVTLAEAWARFGALPRRRARSPRVASQGATIWQDWVSWLAVHAPAVKTLADVRPEHCEAYAGRLEAAGAWTTRQGPLSPRTRNRYRMTCRAVFAALGPRAGLEGNPWDAVPQVRDDSQPRAAFTAVELRRIFAEVLPAQRPLWALGLYTGLRLGDCCTLRWAEVDLAGGWITRRMRKTGGAVRVPLMAGIQQVLAALPQVGEYVLPAWQALYATDPQLVSQQLNRELRRLKIATTTQREDRHRASALRGFHSLRHTFAWLAAEEGVPLSVLQGLVGHATEAMTRAYAAHATGEQARRELHAALPELLGPVAPVKKFTVAQLLAQVQGPAEVMKELARRLGAGGKEQRRRSHTRLV